MRFSNRRGLELAVGTIVILIVSIVILVLATAMTYRAFCGAENLAKSVDAQSADRIDRLMTTNGAKVVVGQNTKTAKLEGAAICGSSRFRTAQFVLGIRAPIEGLVGTVEVKAINADGTDRTPDINEIQMSNKDVYLNGGERELRTILITIAKDKPVGQYVYEVTVTRSAEGAETYGAQLLYVTAE